MTRPHHLRISTSKDKCGNCAWWHKQSNTLIHGFCAMFGGYPTINVEVCDSYEAGKIGSKGSIPKGILENS